MGSARAGIAIFTCALGLAAASAQAACPIADDDIGGIAVEYDNGDRDVFTRSYSPAHLTLDYEVGDGTGRDLVLFGTYFIQNLTLRFDQSGPYVLLRPMEALRTDLKPPAPNTRWDGQIEQTYVFMDERIARPEMVFLSAVWGASTRIDIAGCVYDAVPGRLSETRDGVAPIFSKLVYLPELGIGLLSGMVDWGSGPSTVRPISIEAVQ